MRPDGRLVATSTIEQPSFATDWQVNLVQDKRAIDIWTGGCRQCHRRALATTALLSIRSGDTGLLSGRAPHCGKVRAGKRNRTSIHRRQSTPRSAERRDHAKDVICARPSSSTLEILSAAVDGALMFVVPGRYRRRSCWASTRTRARAGPCLPEPGARSGIRQDQSRTRFGGNRLLALSIAMG